MSAQVVKAAPRGFGRRVGRALGIGLLLALILVGLGMIGSELWADYQVRAANQALAHQDYESAWNHVCLALYGRPRSADLHLLAARAARQSGHYAEAEEHLRRCFDLQGGVSQPLILERMMLAAETGRVETVLEPLFVQVTEGNPSASLILEALCLGLRRAQLAGPATRCAEMWLEREPDNVAALILHGECCGQMGNFHVAVADFQKALQLAPERQGCRQDLAQALLESSQFAAAAEHFEQVLAQEPENRVARLGLARCQIALNEAEQAKAILDTLLDSEGDDAEVLVERGKVALAFDQAEQAEQWFRRALAADPYHHAAAYQLELCLHRAGKKTEADEVGRLRHRIELDMERLQALMTGELSRPGPRPPAVYHEIGEIMLRRGDKEQALYWLYKALESDPTYRATHRLLMEYYEKAGDEKRASRHRGMLPPTGKRKSTD